MPSHPYYLKRWGTVRRILAQACIIFCAIGSSLTLPAQEEKVDDLGNPVKEEVVEDAATLLLNREKEQSIVKRIYNATENLAAAQAAFAELPPALTELELRALRNLDRELARSWQPEHIALVNQAVEKLALSGDANSLQYLHKVFDSQPERRALIATSIAKLALQGKRRPHDWPMLVRSLTVLEGNQIETVTQALLKYRDRALNPTAQRNLLLAGMRHSAATSDTPLQVMAYWANEDPASKLTDRAAKYAAWQAWYAAKYPQLPAVSMPVEDTSKRHRYQALVDYLHPTANHAGQAERGAIIFEKALCIKCHQAGEKGEKVGPNLTKVVQRLTMREIVESVLFPNQQVFDQYITKQLVLQNGKVVSGLVGEQADAYLVLQANTEKIQVPRKEVEEINDTPVSTMPSGLLEAFTAEDVADLMAYLRHVAED
jgi:putative heme-binding domain-containing protein